VSASPLEAIAAAAGLESPSGPPPPPESTRRLAVAAHVAPDRLRAALAERAAAASAGRPLPEPGVGVERVEREARTAGRREAARRLLLVVTAAAVAVLRPPDAAAWIAAGAALFAVELAFRRIRRRHRLRALENGGGPPGSARVAGAAPGAVIAAPGTPFPGTGRDLGSVVLAADLGRPREPGRSVRHLTAHRLERDAVIAVRRLWLPRLQVHARRFADGPDGPEREYVALELPVGEEGALLTTLIRFARRGEALLAEARFRFLPPVSGAYRADRPLDPRRAGDRLLGDVAVSLWRCPFSWLGALGWIGSGVFRPAIAAIRRGDGVQERSLRERFAGRPSPALMSEARQLAAVIRGRWLDALEESLVRRGICPGPVRACTIRGDVTVVEDRPARAPRARRRAGRRGRRSGRVVP
jgi:hypothetical protein